MLILKKFIFALTVTLALFLFAFINTTKAAVPGACSGSWVSPSVYEGYYACDDMYWYPCPTATAPYVRIFGGNYCLGCGGCCAGCAVSLLVFEDSTPPTCTLTANPPGIALGDSSILSWTTTGITLPKFCNPKGCTSNSAIITSVPAGYTFTAPTSSGNTTVTPTVNTIYTMTVKNISGTPVTCTAKVSFPPASCTIIANPSGVFTSGDTLMVSWTITGAASGSISDGTTTTVLTPADIAAKSGSFVTPPITGNTTYTMNVDGAGGPGSCGPLIIGLLTPPTGGLVPCGRMVDNTITGDIDESKPCTICALFYMLKNIINFLLGLAIGVGVFIMVIAGLIYALSVGNPRKIELAKSAASSAIAAIIIIFIAWVAIAVILQAFGYANIGTWNQVNCIL